MGALRTLADLGTFPTRRAAPFLGLAVLAAGLYTGAQVSLPVITGSIVDDALLSGDRHALAIRVLLLVTVALLSTVGKGIQESSFGWLRETSRARLQARLLAELYRRPVAFFDRAQSGLLHSLLIKDATEAIRSTEQAVSETVLGTLQLVLILGILTTEYGAFVLAALGLIPIYALFPLFFARPTRTAARESLTATSKVNACLQESIQAVREVKILDHQNWAIDRLKQLLATDVWRSFRVTLFRSVYSLQYVVYFLAAGLVYWFGGLQVFSGSLTLGKLVALVALMAQLEAPVSRLTRLTHEFQRVSAAVDRIGEVLESEPEPAGDTGRELMPGGHRVAMDAVSFSYDGQDTPAVENITFRLEPGQRVAIVGASGAGKSTLVGLLSRLYSPCRGTISIDGVPLSEYKLESLRREMGFVLQDSMLFAGSVRQNIRIGRPEATDEEVETCARIANAHSFILALEDGYETEIGERGVRLSGGQRQRIGIARVLLRNPSILVLDEAMSALDTESERLVKEALERLMEGRTTVVISHRPSSFIESDGIIVLDEGRVVASGHHEHLKRSCGLYRQLLGEGEEAAPTRLAGAPSGDVAP